MSLRDEDGSTLLNVFQTAFADEARRIGVDIEQTRSSALCTAAGVIAVARAERRAVVAHLAAEAERGIVIDVGHKFFDKGAHLYRDEGPFVADWLRDPARLGGE